MTILYTSVLILQVLPYLYKYTLVKSIKIVITYSRILPYVEALCGRDIDCHTIKFA